MRGCQKESRYILVLGLLLLLICNNMVECKGGLIKLDLIKLQQKNEESVSDIIDDRQNEKEYHFKKQIKHKQNQDDTYQYQKQTNNLNITSSYLRNIQNNQYTVTLYFGQNSQKLSLLVDSGSAFTLVESKTCESCKDKNKDNANQQFDCTASSSCKVISNNPYELTFAEGKALALMTQDVTCLMDEQHYCAKNEFRFMNIVNITSQSKPFLSLGRLGIGFSKKNLSLSLIQQLYENGEIPEPSFTLYITDVRYDRRHQKDVSKLILGGIDLNYGAANASLTYHSVETKDQWSLALGYVKFNDKVINRDTSNTALIDSGSSYLVLPQDDLNDLLKYLNGDNKQICQQHESIIQCSCPNGDIEQFPHIQIQFNTVDKVYTLLPREYIVQENHVCNMLITSYSSKSGQWILGDVFLRKYMAYFNFEKETIGLILSNQQSLEQNELAKDSILILECFLGSLFLGILVIYFIRMLSGLKNAKDEDLTF